MKSDTTPELKSMKLPPREKTTAEVMYPGENSPEYPWGLRLHLDEEQIKALGLTELPKTGVPVTITAKADVCGTAEYDTQNKGTQRSIDIQITDLALS